MSFLDKTNHLDKKALLNGAPLAIKAIAGPAIDWLNNLNLNKNQTDDIVELAPKLQAAMPLILALAPLINWEALLENILTNFVKDRKEAEQIVDNLKAVGQGIEGPKA